MINEKLKEILANPQDGALSIVTQGENGPHVVNSWNSYVNITADEKLLIPVGRMVDTERNIERDSRVKLTVASREVMGKMYKGAGFLITGTARFDKEGPDFDVIKSKFPWARAALAVTIESAEQTL